MRLDTKITIGLLGIAVVLLFVNYFQISGINKSIQEITGLVAAPTEKSPDVLAEPEKSPAPVQEEDWTVFKNSLPSDMKEKILSFEFAQPKQTSNQRVLDYEGYEGCVDSLIVFYYAGCGWCKRYYPILVQAEKDYPDMELYALDLGQNRDIAEKFNVRGTPANIINCKYFASGYMDKEVLYGILDRFG